MFPMHQNPRMSGENLRLREIPCLNSIVVVAADDEGWPIVLGLWYGDADGQGWCATPDSTAFAVVVHL